ncbi:MAG: hypothetical protein AB7U45_16670 [Desulfamplus sp.]
MEMGQSKLSGKKLKIVMRLKKLQTADIVAGLNNTTAPTVEKWKQRGVPLKVIQPLALLLNIDEGLLSNDDIDEEIFTERIKVIINNGEYISKEEEIIQGRKPKKGILSSDFDKVSAILKSTAKIYDNFWEPQK